MSPAAAAFPPKTFRKPLNPAPAPAAVYWLLAAVHVVCPLLFFTDLTRNPYFTQIALLNGGLCLCVLLFVAHGLRYGRFSLTLSPVDGPILGFVAAALISWALSWARHPSFRVPIANEGWRVTMFLLINALAAYALGAQLRDPAWDKRFIQIVLWVGAFAGAYGVMQYMGKEFIWSQALNPYSGRPVSTFGNPNFLSSYLVLLLPVSLALAAGAETPGLRWGYSGFFWLFAGAIIATFTRSSWIGALFAVGLFAVLAWPRLKQGRRWLAGALLVVGLMCAFWPPSPLADHPTRPIDRVTELVHGISRDKSYGSWHQRLMIWSCAWDMVKEKPFFGKGWGCFELFYPFYQGWYLSDHVFRNFRTHANNAHNIILEFWSQTGTVGLSAILLVILLFAETCRRRIPLLPEQDRLLAWAFLAGGAGMLVDNFFGNVSIFFAVPAFLFFWMMGVLARWTSPSSERVIGSRGVPALAASLLAAAFCAYGMAHWYDQWRAEIDYFDGFKKIRQGDLKSAIDALERSHGERRFEVNANYELANAYARQGRWASDNHLPTEAAHAMEKALWAYDEAIKANGGYDEIYFNRATILAQMGRVDDAVLDYRTSLLINPLSLDGYRALGNVYLGKPAWREKAVELFERALFYYPADRDLWNNLGFLYSERKEHAKAVDAYAEAIRIDFQFEIAWKNFRSALLSAGRKDHPLLQVPALWQKVQEEGKAARWADARRDAEALSALLPGNEQAELVLANVRAQQKDFPAAITLYLKILERSPGQRQAKLNLARVYANSGRRDDALALLREMAREHPQDAEVSGLLLALGGGPVSSTLHPTSDLVE